MQTAIRHHQAGRLAEAEEIYRQILDRQPGHAQALELLGALNLQRGRSDVAVDLIGRALALRPNWPEALSNRGEALRVQGRLDEAIADHRQVIALEPNRAQAHYNFGVALKDKGQLDEAIAAYRRAIALKPDYARAFGNLGNALREKEQVDEAIAACRQAIALKPDFAEAHSNLSAALRDKGLQNEAIAACRQAIALRPNFPEAYTNLGNALRDKGLMDAAIAAYHQAIAVKPEFVEAYTNLGSVLKDMGRLDEAIAACRRAIALKPDSPEAHYSFAFVLLLNGDFAEGWAEHEWRWLFKDFPAHRWSSSKPQWDGSDLANRTILLYCEQGFGDILQFIRFVPMVAGRGGNVIVMCPPHLRRLFQSVPGVGGWVVFDEPLPQFDVHCPLMSLPLAFGTTLETIPASVPYLHAEAGEIERWRERLAGEPAGLKVGLVWAGRSTHKNDHNRSVPLSILAPLAEVPGVNFYSLQKGEPAAQAKHPPGGMKLVDWTQELNDFADTAALIANLDLVVSVDTAVAHLSGAVSRPVWLLAPFVTDWRWPLGREDSPWYPTMRVFRQKATGQWDEIIERVAKCLALHAQESSTRRIIGVGSFFGEKRTGEFRGHHP